MHSAVQRANLDRSYHDEEVRMWALIKFDIGEKLRAAESGGKCGLLPRLARGYLGRLQSESFCERILSVANMIVTKENMTLPSADVKKQTILRVNRKFMELCSFNDADGVDRLSTADSASSVQLATAEAAAQLPVDDTVDTLSTKDDSIIIDDVFANEFNDPLEARPAT